MRSGWCLHRRLERATFSTLHPWPRANRALRRQAAWLMAWSSILRVRGGVGQFLLDNRKARTTAVKSGRGQGAKYIRAW